MKFLHLKCTLKCPWTSVSIYSYTYWPSVSYKIWSNLQTYLWTDQSKDVVMLKLFTTGTTLYPTPWWSPVFPSQTQILFANNFSKYVIDWSQSCNLALNVIKKFNLPARRWWNITLNADYSVLALPISVTRTFKSFRHFYIRNEFPI